MKDGTFKKYLYISLAGAVGVILCIVFFFALFRFEQVLGAVKLIEEILMPFIYGAVIAYLLTPICNFLERKLQEFLGKWLKHEKRIRQISGAAGIFLSLLFGFCVIYLLMAMVLPQVFTSISRIVASLPANVAKWSAWLQQHLDDNLILKNYVNQFSTTAYQNLENWLQTELLPNMQVIVSGVSAGLINALVIVKNVLIGIIAAAYMMASRRKFAAQGKKLVYSFFRVDTANAILDEFRLIDRMFGGFISGKLLDSLIIGCLCFVLMNLLKMPYTMLISVIVGVTNIIPFFGPYFGAVPSALIVLTVSPVQCVYFLLLILALQQFDGNFLGPKILGNSTGLSGFWVLFSILLFGGLMGFVGMIIGVPAFAVLYDLIKKGSHRLLKKKRLSTDTGVYQELKAVEQSEEGWIYIQKETVEESSKQKKEEEDRKEPGGQS